jgi:hypothetical protein
VSLRPVTFDSIYTRVLRELRLNPASWTPSLDQAEFLCEKLTDRARKAYQQQWWTRLCPLVERDVTDDDGLYVPYVGDDFLFIDAVNAVYRDDPRVSGTNTSIRFALSDRGIELPIDAPDTTVFVHYRVAAPKGTKVAWSNATAYRLGDVVYSGGETYVCIQAHTNQAVSVATYWAKQLWPEFLLRYLTLAGAADWFWQNGDSERAAQYSARADGELMDLRDTDQGQQHQFEFSTVIVH